MDFFPIFWEINLGKEIDIFLQFIWLEQISINIFYFKLLVLKGPGPWQKKSEFLNYHLRIIWHEGLNHGGRTGGMDCNLIFIHFLT